MEPFLAFGLSTPHVGIDNASDNQIRLSSDSRYQLVADTVDPRRIGPEPMVHGKSAKRQVSVMRSEGIFRVAAIQTILRMKRLSELLGNQNLLMTKYCIDHQLVVRASLRAAMGSVENTR